MAYSEVLANRVRELLAHLPDVQEKRMFRGVSFMVNDKMCVNISLDRLMCRIDPAIHDSLVEREGCVTVNMRGRDLKGWMYVDEDVLRTEKDLRFWVDLALAFNKDAKASVKKKPKQAKKKRPVATVKTKTTTSARKTMAKKKPAKRKKK